LCLRTRNLTTSTFFRKLWFYALIFFLIVTFTISLWYSLSLIRALAIWASVHDKPCDLQEQRFVAQIVLHPQLMSSINASRLLVHPVNRQHIFLPSLFFSWYIDWQARFQTAAWKYALCVFLLSVFFR
jgi:hypothetical protein